ncbi:transmembrane protein 205 [Anabrus simplex]|uniref:transmembrane protein 205 n=1 Tax=Anabrus simplex TaxID=316456 RepID=UPI0034DDB394
MCFRSKIGESDTVSPVVESRYQMAQKLKKQKRKAMQQHQSNLERETSASEVAPNTLNRDLLALSTIYYRVLLCAITDFFAKYQDTRFYRILFCTTQPAHLVLLIAVVTTVTLVSPYQSSDDGASSSGSSPLTNLVYLTAFMMHFGAQMWMTFVSGLTLYFAVPRHTFGEVQRVLFPKYFGMNSILSAITLYIFVSLHPSNTWDTCIALQVGSMVTCFLLELIIRLYLTPPLLRLMSAKNAIETAAGVGLEIGKHDPGVLIQCPHYVKIHQAFRKIHMTVAIGNMLTMACTLIHAHYLASKICML